MKQRPPDRRLPIIVADAAQAREALPLRWSPASGTLANAFWPGALTIAFATEPPLPGWLSARKEVAVRAPDHELIAGIAARVGPLLMTSANRHGAATPTSVRDVLAHLAFPPAISVDAGRLSEASSTLVNTNLPCPEVEREGAIPASVIAEALRDAR